MRPDKTTTSDRGLGHGFLLELKRCIRAHELNWLFSTCGQFGYVTFIKID